MLGFFLSLPALLAPWLKDETVSGYALRGAAYVLEEVDAAPAPWEATLIFPRKGRIRGETACGRFRARQTVPYPWLSVEAVQPARDCAADARAAEAAFLVRLTSMTLAEASGRVLILSNDTGGEMVFVAD